jgi:hypothetical protein
MSEGVARYVIEAAAISRHPTPVRSITLWIVVCSVLVVVAHVLIARTGLRPGSCLTGTITLAGFALAACYSARKRSLRGSIRILRIAALLPTPIARRIVSVDRLESWRFVHVAIGILLLLPFWLHVDAGLRAGRIEIALGALLALLVLSGIIGASIEEFLPHAMQLDPEHQVRTQDVEDALDALYREAEEMILGHSEMLTSAYVETIRPILQGTQPWPLLMRATLTGTDPSDARCAQLRARAAQLGAGEELYGELVNTAARKIRLEQNRFNLLFGMSWLRFHITLALLTSFVIVFHVLGVLYLIGL